MTDTPHYSVRIEHIRVPTRDGTFLAADLVRPDCEGSFPAIIEYHPYRKDDVTRGIEDVHRYFAARGFVGVRLDVRGTGGSEGFNTDEYLAVEQRDGYDAVEWVAAQPWSNGRVGMWGSSYGGFTSIQVAMQRPPHLAAIVPIYATDDRYTDDCHYTPGGSMRMYFDVGTYGGLMVAMNSLPPSPDFGGGGWADLWRTRLENNEPYLLEWLRHPVDGPYWRGASLRPGYDRIACPVLLIAGWHDGYSSPMLRMFTQLKTPTRIIIGPWSHMRPNVSLPGPRIDYIAEMVQFFARHLRDDPAVPEGPRLAVYMQEFTTPFRTLDQIPGYWRSETTVAPEGSADLELFLGPGGSLAPETADAGVDEYDYRPTVGVRNGYWSAGGMAYYLAADQREDEAYSVCYTTEPFERETHVFGWPRVFLCASSSARMATFVAKLADVAPDGTSVLISDGSLNATRRDSLTDPAPLEPGVVYPLEIPMAPTGWVLAAGHRLRLAVSSSDFPNLWPTPEPARNQVHRGGVYPSRIVLPVVPAPTHPGPTFAPPPALESSVKTYPDPPMQQVVVDQVTGVVTVENRRAYTVVLDGNRGVLWNESRMRATASETDPAQASVAGSHRYRLEREDGVFEVVGDSSLRGTTDTFHLVVALEVKRNGVTFFQRTWTASEPRRLL